MKKLNKQILLLVAAFLFTSLAAVAEDDTRDPVNKLTGLGFTKKVEPDLNRPNGYNITLTAFTTGSVKTTSDIQPAVDIVLVLDVSGSMGDPLLGSQIAYSDLQSRTEYYLKRGDNYYYYYKSRNNEYYSSFDFYDKSSSYQNYYYNQNGDTFYRVSSTTRLQAMKAAAKSFVETVKRNNPDGNKKHRVGIVSFANTSNAVSQLTHLNKTDDTDVTGLQNAIDRLTASGATNADLGINAAYDMINSDEAQADGRGKVVVFFTDGQPTSSWEFEPAVARRAVQYAHLIKGIHTTMTDDLDRPVYDKDNNLVVLDAKVWSVGLLFSETFNNLYNIRRFMHYVSSNYDYNITSTSYTFAQNFDTSANPGGDEDPSTNKYYKLSTGTADDLKSIFDAIANESSNTPSIAYELKETDIVAVDIISQNFKLPDGAVPEDITVQVAPFKKINSTDGLTQGQISRNEHYEFDNPVDYDDAVNYSQNPCAKAYAPQRDDEGKIMRDPQGNIIYTTTELEPTVEIVNNNKEIRVSGFNYIDNWCGMETNTTTHQETPHGYQLVITIPIETSSSNEGGATVDTNDEGSGIVIYGDDGVTPVASTDFPRPIVTLPNIIICKYGLETINESASFKVEKLKNTGTETNPTWVVDGKADVYTFVVTCKNLAPDDFNFVQIKLQEPGRYRVTETTWGWSYEPGTSTEGLNDPSEEYRKTTTSTLNNRPYMEREICAETEQEITIPGTNAQGGTNKLAGAIFKFTNKKNENIEPRNYSEHVVVNEFNNVTVVKPKTQSQNN